jgi:adenosylmethionine-8-amino-7-oxononanoate aminotransferase
MSAFVVLGTDTDAGKTTFSLLWLAHFAPRYAYWKPVETGPSDSANIARLVPGVLVHPSIVGLAAPLAPPLAARQEKRDIPSAEALASARPGAEFLLIESFGGPFSPLNETELQVAFLKNLKTPAVLVGPSRLGAVGRALAMSKALAAEGIPIAATVLLGSRDRYAEEALAFHVQRVFHVEPPNDDAWTPDGVCATAKRQSATLDAIRAALSVRRDAKSSEPSADDTTRETNMHIPHGKQSALRSEDFALRRTEILDADRRCVWHPYTSLDDPDALLPIVGAEAEFLHLADGRRIIDGISSWWTIQHGHCHPPLMQALHEASQQIDHVVFAGATHPWGVGLARELLATTRWNGGRVFYSDNGSTAVEVALKLAYQYWVHQGQPQRTTFVGFTHGYHGDTFGAMAVSRDPVFFGTFEPLLFRAEILPIDPQRLDEFLKKHAGETAGVVMEPLVQGAGGMRFHEPATLRELFDVAKRHDVLFLVDEVMTGLGRLGTFWAHEAASIVPDLIASAKTIAGGVLPLAATLVSPRIEAAFHGGDRRRTFFHGHSFTAHPLACAVGIANLLLVRAALPEAPQRLERFWRTALADLADRPGVVEVRVRGTIVAVELDLPGGYLADASRTMRKAALDAGVFLRPLGNLIYAMPPWCISDASLGKIADAIHAATRAALSTRS